MRSNSSPFPFLPWPREDWNLQMDLRRCFPDGSGVRSLLANAGAQVRSLMQEDPACCGAAQPVSNY